ncbi:TIGR03915 family putative DNA repair protein [Sphingobacterium rhinopitheci]|uniref:TIGR03915 family putative DNA repair protein n=1 Tax=Sphingobacterium rhinopitheci TaxID=2781960 RepID=UPI001F5234AD|nr:TIGR03915 family putative DNA repair protein [Sphingobacterium rhinopitheci]MCI0921315.1 TIGR03915 family putative DNA repair protein [Sphingobacterium rhinopitheci]
MNYLFDGSFQGLLTCVFEAFEFKDVSVRICEEQSYSADMFSQTRTIITNQTKAERIWKGLSKHLKKSEIRSFYSAYLSEDAQAYQAIFNLMVRGFSTSFNLLHDYGDNDVMTLSQTLKKVGREQHRMKAFVRFQKSNDGLYFSMVDPDFNVLPLIIAFFKNRYADQRWMIYDVRRNYGFMYDKTKVFEIQLFEHTQVNLSIALETIELDDSELKYQRLWKQYFKSTNIEARKNTKLHIQHVPKRYWKYLIEKQSL